MPKAWSQKDDRQYEHIRKSERERGKKPEKAKEIAARTVNKQRREEGHTERVTTSGTGNPNSSLETRTVAELRNRARELSIRGRSRMNKSALIRAIRSRS